MQYKLYRTTTLYKLKANNCQWFGQIKYRDKEDCNLSLRSLSKKDKEEDKIAVELILSINIVKIKRTNFPSVEPNLIKDK